MKGAARSLIAALIVACPGAGGATQLPAVDAADAGLGDHTVATARGVSAVAVNPAGLGLGGARFTAAAFPVRYGAGLEPVSLGEISEWGGEVVPAAVRERWLLRVRRSGPERGAATASVTPLALSVGPFGVQVSTVAAGRVALNDDATELLLFGNAGRTGESRTFDLGGSSLDGWLVSTLGVAWGVPVRELRGGLLALGVTGKISVGHALLVGRDAGSTLDGTTPDVRLAFPVLTVEPGAGAFGGARGVGVDLGAAWEREDLSLGVTVRNAVSTFGWELDDLAYRPGTALFQGEDETASDFDPRPAVEAPLALRRATSELEFGPVVEVGLGAPLGSRARVVASVERTFGHDAGVVPTSRAGVGIEMLAAERLPVQAHASVVERSLRVGAGASLGLGGFRVGGAGSATLGSTQREGWIGAFSLSWSGGDRRAP